MIASAKIINKKNEQELYTVYFLTREGDEVEEKPQIENRQYISEQDHDKYGKVEVYKVGNHIRQDYFLKQFRGGRPGELLVDPYGMFSKPEDLSAFVSQRGHRFCEYTQVPDNIYHCYVSYLQTRDSRYFRSCEKFILDNVK